MLAAAESGQQAEVEAEEPPRKRAATDANAVAEALELELAQCEEPDAPAADPAAPSSSRPVQLQSLNRAADVAGPSRRLPTLFTSDSVSPGCSEARHAVDALQASLSEELEDALGGGAASDADSPAASDSDHELEALQASLADVLGGGGGRAARATLDDSSSGDD